MQEDQSENFVRIVKITYSSPDRRENNIILIITVEGQPIQSNSWWWNSIKMLKVVIDFQVARSLVPRDYRLAAAAFIDYSSLDLTFVNNNELLLNYYKFFTWHDQLSRLESK